MYQILLYKTFERITSPADKLEEKIQRDILININRLIHSTWCRHLIQIYNCKVIKCHRASCDWTSHRPRWMQTISRCFQAVCRICRLCNNSHPRSQSGHRVACRNPSKIPSTVGGLLRWHRLNRSKYWRIRQQAGRRVRGIGLKHKGLKKRQGLELRYSPRKWSILGLSLRVKRKNRKATLNKMIVWWMFEISSQQSNQLRTRG